MNFKTIKCIFYDFDGVMTDNRCLIDEEGGESVFVSRSDGYAVSRIREMGICQVIVSTETSSVVEKRAEKLKIPVIHGVEDKGETVREYCLSHHIDLRNCLFIGNDLNDMPAFRIVGMRGAPADAEEEILSAADWISGKKGGHGVIRDLYRQMVR